MLAKRFGEKIVFWLGLLVVTLGLVLLSQSPNFAVALSARTIWIIGYRVAFVCVMMAVARVVPAHRPQHRHGDSGSDVVTRFCYRRAIRDVNRCGVWMAQRILAFAGMGLLGSIVFWIFYRAPEMVCSIPHLENAPAHSIDANVFSNPLVWSMVLLGLTNMGGFSANFFVPSAVRTTFHLGTDGCGLHHQRIIRHRDLRKPALRLFG